MLPVLLPEGDREGKRDLGAIVERHDMFLVLA